MNPSLLPKPIPKGLSLLEAIVVFLVFAICVSSSLVVVSGQRMQRQWQLTEWRMQRIEQLLHMHLAAFGRLPCPSDISRAPGDALAGVEAAVAGRCTGQIPSANMTDTTGQRVMGGVPFATLGLAEQDVLDGWGNRMMMAVVTGWTTENTRGTASFQLRDMNDQVVEDQVAVVLWSAGADAHGAYEPDGGLVRRQAIVSSPWQLENCNCDEAGRSLGVNPLFYQRGTMPEGAADSARLDDVVRGLSVSALQRVQQGEMP